MMGKPLMYLIIYLLGSKLMSKYIILLIGLTFFKTEAQTSVLKLADSLYANGYYSKAIAQYEVYNKPSEVYEKIAKASIAIGNYNQALLNYQESIKAHPNNTLLKYE